MAARSPTSPTAATRCMATDAALRIADYVVTEAGFGADLGAEKFFDIKCRVGRPRARRRGGGGDRPGAEDARRRRQVGPGPGGRGGGARAASPTCAATSRTCASSACRWWWRSTPSPATRPAEIAAIEALSAERWASRCTSARHFADGGAGAVGLAEAVVALAESGAARFAPLYPDSLPLADKIRCVATEIYRARDVEFSPRGGGEAGATIEAAGFGARAGLHGQDPVQLLRRPRPARRARGLRAAGARRAPLRRRRLRGRALPARS